MNVKFTVDYDLIELVDAYGLDYDIVNKEIIIEVDNVEELVENEEELHVLNDSELCEYLLSPELCEGLIYTQRIYN